MARIAILQGDKPDDDSEAYKTYEGLQSLGKDDYTIIRYADLLFSITTSQVKITYAENDLAQFDLVYIRDFRGYEHERNAVALYLSHLGVAFLNTDISQFQHISKLTQYMAFSYESLAIPASLFGSSDAVKAEAAKLGYPLVVKAIVASSGNDNFLAHSSEDLERLLDEHKDGKMIVQAAIPNDGDYRHVVLDGTVSCVYHRVSVNGDHRNNISQGGQKSYLDLHTVPESHTTLAIRAAKAVGREICGVDIMEDTRTHTPIVLEANFNFGIRAVTGQLSDELYGLAEYLHNKANS